MTLIEATRAALRRAHSSSRTEEAYVHWIRAFVRFHARRHPRDMGAPEIVAFLNDLAVGRNVAASTLNQALCAVVFLYRRVLELPMPALDGPRGPLAPRGHGARRPPRPPFRLIAELLYGSGLRLMEALALRVKDVDLDRRQAVKPPSFQASPTSSRGCNGVGLRASVRIGTPSR